MTEETPKRFAIQARSRLAKCTSLQIFCLIVVAYIGISAVLGLAPEWHNFCELTNNERNYMLGWTLMFLVIALVAGVLGFTSIAGTAAGIAQILFIVFLVLFLASLVSHLLHSR
jgi:uncharacterized membrane protein YtjA (UPF0391 family)